MSTNGELGKVLMSIRFRAAMMFSLILNALQPSASYGAEVGDIFSGERIVRTGLSLGIVCALVVLLVPKIVRARAEISRKTAGDLPASRVPKGMRVIERVDVSDQHSLIVVEVPSGDRLLFSYDGESLELQTKLPADSTPGTGVGGEEETSAQRVAITRIK